jgi:hypothetical protein
MQGEDLVAVSAFLVFWELLMKAGRRFTVPFFPIRTIDVVSALQKVVCVLKLRRSIDWAVDGQILHSNMLMLRPKQPLLSPSLCPFARLHGISLWYSMEIFDDAYDIYWLKFPLLKKLMAAHPDVEWFMVTAHARLLS